MPPRSPRTAPLRRPARRPQRASVASIRTGMARSQNNRGPGASDASRHGPGAAGGSEAQTAKGRDVVFSEYTESEEAMVRSDRFKLIVGTGRRARKDRLETGSPSGDPSRNSTTSSAIRARPRTSVPSQSSTRWAPEPAAPHVRAPGRLVDRSRAGSQGPLRVSRPSTGALRPATSRPVRDRAGRGSKQADQPDLPMSVFRTSISSCSY